jgi:hypothetical protein
MASKHIMEQKEGHWYTDKNLYGKRPKIHIHGRDKKKKVVFVLFQIKEGK